MLWVSGRRLLVVDPTQEDGDRVGDVKEILTSLCARLHWRRAGASRAARGVAAVAAIAAIAHDVP